MDSGESSIETEKQTERNLKKHHKVISWNFGSDLTAYFQYIYKAMSDPGGTRDVFRTTDTYTLDIHTERTHSHCGSDAHNPIRFKTTKFTDFLVKPMHELGAFVQHMIVLINKGMPNLTQSHITKQNSQLYED